MIIKEKASLEGLPGVSARPSNRPMSLETALALLAGREPIGMWDLMLWAFNREKVRYSCGTSIAARASASSMASAMAAGASGIVLGADCGGGYSSPCCHEDACLVYVAVSDVIGAVERSRDGSISAPRLSPADAMSDAWLKAPWPDVTRFSEHELRLDDSLNGRPMAQPAGEDARLQAFKLLILQTEIAKAPPDWELELEPLRCHPVLRANGKPKCILGSSGRYQDKAMACLVRYTGHSKADAATIRAAAQARYAMWVGLLDQVIHRLGPDQPGLTRFRVNGVGVDRMPWAERAQHAA